MGFKMKFPLICWTVLLTTYGVWEGSCFTLSDVTPTALGVDMSVQFDVTLTDSTLSNPSCLFDIGNGELSQHQLAALTTGTYTVSLPYSGFFDVLTICMNEGYYDNFTLLNVYIGDVITGPSATGGLNDVIIPVTWPVASDVSLPISFDTGTDVAVSAVVERSGGTYTDTGFNATLAKNLILPLTEFVVPGMYAVTITFTNPLSTVTITVVLAVYEPISVTSVAFSPASYEAAVAAGVYYVMTDTPFDIITTFSGGDATLTWEVIRVDGPNTTVAIPGYFCAGMVDSHTFSYTFASTGLYYLRLVVSNHINEYVHPLIIVKSQYGVNGFTNTATDAITLIANSVDFLINVAGSALYDMGNVVCTFDHGNGDSVSFTFDYTATLVPLTYTDTYTYPAIGHFIAVVTCANELPPMVNDVTQSYQEWTYYMKILNPVANLQLQHTSSIPSNHPYSEPITFTFSLTTPGVDPDLPNITCFVDFDSGGNFLSSTDDATSNSTVTIVEDSFPDGDLTYTASINCSNELTSQTFPDISFYIYYDCWSKKYFDYQYRDPTTPLIAFTHLHYTIFADIQPADLPVCVGPLILLWQIYDDTPTLVGTDVITPPTLPSFYIDEYTFSKGLFKFEFTTEFSQSPLPTNPRMTDYAYVKFEVTDLIPKIADENELINPIRGNLRASNLIIDSSMSYDPAENPDPNGLDQTWLTSTPLVKTWTCVKGAPALTHAEVTSFIAGAALPHGTTACPAGALPGGNDQDRYDIEPDTFEANRWYIYTMTYSRGVDRTAVAKQAVHITNLPPLTLEIICFENCFPGSGMRQKIRLAPLQVNIAIRDLDVDNSSAIYAWTVEKYVPPALTNTVDITHLITGLKNDTGFYVQKEIFASAEPGTTFVVSCMVTIEDYEPTKISQLYIYNYPPYNGVCIIDTSDATAAMTLVCVDCRGFKDENLNLERNPTIDEGGGLLFAFMQIFIDDDDAINTEYLEIQLDASSSPKQCVRLQLPPDQKNRTMVELRVKDYMRTPYAFQQFFVNVEPALAFDISGEDGATSVNALVGSGISDINSAAEVGDVNAVATIIATLSSCLYMSGPETDYNIPVESSMDGTAFTDILEDGTIVSREDAFEDMLKKIPDPATVAIQEAKALLASKLAAAQANATAEQKTDPTLQQNMLNSAKVLVSGDEDCITSELLELAGNIISSAAENLEAMVDRGYGDTAEMDAFILECLDTLGALSGAIQNNDAQFLMGDLDEAETRAVNENQFAFSSSERQEEIEKADMTDDERTYTMFKRNLRIAAKTAERIGAGNAQSERTDKFLAALMKTVVPSDNAVNIYGNPDESRIYATTTRLTVEMARKTPLKGSGVEVALPQHIDTEGKITMALLEDKTIVNMNKKGRFADATSRESHFELQMQESLIGGTIKFTFKITPAVYATVYPVVHSEDADKFARGQMWVRSPDDMVCISNKPLSDRIDYYKVWITGTGHVSKLNFDAEETLNDDNNWTNCFLPSYLSLDETGICRYGIETFFKDSDSSSRKKRAASNDTLDEYPPMNQTAATMACMVLNDDKEWVSDLCAATWLPEQDQLICDCLPEKKMTFANSFYVPPNTIDFSSVFLKFSPLNQAAVMGVLAGILLIYVLIVVWARRKDKKDLLKWGITPLADNFAEDNYFYVIKVYTGIRPGAKTRSKVGMVIAGDEMDTGVRELSDGVRKEFSTGSVVNFLMSTNVYLGELEYIRVWHDNSGRGNLASWYLSKIEVQDVQRNETFSFLAERWLAVEKDDGMLECVVPVCKVENLNVFKNRFYMNAKENLADSHIWVSVVYRPVTSHFTRVQRATCALVFLMLTMISNAMFFRGEDNYETPAQVQVGPFRFTMQQIYISLICALITTPATLVIIYLFKLSKPKPPLDDKPLFTPSGGSGAAGTPGGAGKQRAKKYKIPLVETWIEKQQRKSMELEQSLVAKGYPQYDGFNLPYWGAYIAWFLAFAAWFLCGFFIMLYSMEWGKQKSEEWLTTFFLSFFESVFCLDPVKIAVMAVVFAILVRSAQDSKSVIDRSTIMKKYKSNLRGKSGGIRLPAPPIDTEKLEQVRAHRQLELKVKTAFKDIIFNLFIIWILFSLSYATRDAMSYHMHHETFETLLHPRGQTSFFDIKTINGYFDWLNNTAINNLFPEDDLTGERLHWRLRQFLGDGAKFRVGPPRLRQVRTIQRKCKIPYMGEFDCYKGYSELDEDTDAYCIGWNNTPCHPDEAVYKHSSDAWRFTSAFDIWGVPISGHYTTYGGGGYISKLSVNREVSHMILEELYENSWVDRQTRSVVFEFTLYCLNTNIFTYNVFMAEFPETGGVNPYVMILPLRVYMHNGALGLYTLMCEVIFLLYLVAVTVYVIVLLVQQKKAFFKKPWQVFDFVFVIFSYVTMIMYFIRMVMTNKSLTIWREDPKEFVNFYHVALWDQMFVLMVGILAFMSVIRLLNVLGYNKRINAVARVFSNAASELLWFGIFFINVFMCYAVFGYLLFGSKLRSYKNIYKTMGTLFISMIGKSRFTEIEDADPMMSKIYFMFFIFFVVYMMLTMFLAMLSKSIDQVHADTKTRKGDELVDYIVNKFKGMLSNNREENQGRGLGGAGATPPAPWNVNVKSKQRWHEIDNRAILEDIRQSLNDAIIFDPEGLQKKAKGPAPAPGGATKM